MTALADLLPAPRSVVARPGHLCAGGWRVTGEPDLAAAVRVVLGSAGASGAEAAAASVEAASVGAAYDPSLADEAYGLVVAPDGVEITSATVAGARLAAWTLLQLGDRRQPLPACEIHDAPRLPWRGMLLDVARHMMPLEWLYGFVRQLAAIKYNRLQLHLSDDEGWRFESRRHPELHLVGGERQRTAFPGLRPADERPHRGWYSQNELRELVAYAAGLGVTVVPEVSMPGHSGAWQAAMPWLSSNPQAFGPGGSLPDGVAPAGEAMIHAIPAEGVPDGPGYRARAGIGARAGVGSGTHEPFPRPWRVLGEALDLTPQCLAVVGDVLDELVTVFDAPWVHTGGDEVAPAASARQGEFTLWLSEQLAARGRTAAVWDEAVQSCPQTRVLVTAWRGQDAVVRATEAGWTTVAATHPMLYLDHRQHADDPDVGGSGWLVTWEDVLAYDPLAGLRHPERVLGSQCQLWTETLPTPRHVEVAAWPRAAAHAQAAWSGPSADPDGFLPRLTAHLGRLDRAGVAYRHPSGLPRWWLP